MEITLYRKYRPIDFESVIGQETVVKTLKNQIASGNISHAYLFSGTRGTGKTTIAKIFARAINCPNEKNGNPCNECTTCRQALDNANLNIYEMDAASNNGVEGVRHIGELIAYPPINNEKYKVFIIDEAHALSSQATQAILKMLEEPPKYVVYILATTDPNKLPETILSRCQKYNFKRISIEDIVKYLKKICTEEKINITDEALTFIAEKSDGSMRESISKLDRCRSYANDVKIEKKLVVDILGIVDDDDFSNLCIAVNEGNIEKAFIIVSESIEKGKDITLFANDFIWYLRNLLIVKDLKGPIEALSITKETFEKLKKNSENISKESLLYFIESLSIAAKNMKFDENRRVILETTLIRLATPKTSYLESAFVARLNSIEEKIGTNSFVQVKSEENKTEFKNETKKEEKISEIKLKPATFQEIKKVVENWKSIIAGLDRREKTVLGNAKPIPENKEEPGFINVLITDSYMFNLIEDVKKTEENIRIATQKIIGKDIIFKIIKPEETNVSSSVVFKLDMDAALSKIDMEVLKDDK